MFVDFKAAFDSVDRRVLLDTMKKRGIRDRLIKRVGEALRETSCRIKVGGELGERFWTEREVRQGCPLNPLLFTSC